MCSLIKYLMANVSKTHKITVCSIWIINRFHFKGKPNNDSSSMWKITHKIR